MSLSDALSDVKAEVLAGVGLSKAVMNVSTKIKENDDV